MGVEAEIAEGGRVRAFRRVAALEGLEVLQADFGRYRFPAHAHDRDVISLIGRGSHSVERRGSRTVADAGSVVMMPRGWVHQGGSVDEAGWRILTLYLPERLLDDVAGELVGGRPGAGAGGSLRRLETRLSIPYHGLLAAERARRCVRIGPSHDEDRYAR